jgi:hypothetical protein
MTTNMTTTTKTNTITNTEGEGRVNGAVFCRKTLPRRLIVVAVVDAPLLLSTPVSQRAAGVNTGADQSQMLPAMSWGKDKDDDGIVRLAGRGGVCANTR